MSAPSSLERSIITLEAALAALDARWQACPPCPDAPRRMPAAQKELLKTMDVLQDEIERLSGLEAVRCRSIGQPSRFRLELAAA